MKPKCLDLFCGAGGASMGLHRAGFDVTGIDIKPQPRYPFRFIQADALKPPVRLEDFDLVWASPPCQGYSIMRNLPWLKNREYPMLIPVVREMLQASGRAFIIENVNQARRRRGLPDGIEGGFLCGTMFGLPIYRHRRFETNFLWMAPAHAKHENVIKPGSFLGSRAAEMSFTRKNGMKYGFDQPGAAVGHSNCGGMSPKDSLGVPWMSRDDATQAIPPAYSEHIGKYALMALGQTPD